MTSENKKALEYLCESVKGEVSEKRFGHILGVRDCALRIANSLDLGLSEDEMLDIASAALLHDVTKDKSEEWHKSFIEKNGITLAPGDECIPQVWHSFTAPVYISLTYPAFSNETVLSAVGKHSVGDERMSLADKIICLADYIEDGRKYDSCVEIRKRFFSFDFSSASADERVHHLDRCLLMTFLSINEHLEANGERISNTTQKAVTALQNEINSTEVPLWKNYMKTE